MSGPYMHRSKTIPRRAFLRGCGVGIALPMLQCMKPAFARESPAAPCRMLVISNNLGVLPKPFFPDHSGRDYELSPYLNELQSFRDDFTVFSGLSHPGVIGGHSTENCFLTAARGPTRSGFRNRISLDQFAADRLGQQTRFATLNLGINIDKANRSLSWTRDGALLPAEDSPSALFRKMFVQGSGRDVERRLQELRLRGSILDAVTTETRQFSKSLGRNDRQRLDQYFNSVRELEQRLHIARQWETRPKPVIEHDPPVDILDDARLFDKCEMMLSMAQLALETDSTRIVTLMVDAFATGVFRIDEETKSINAYHNLSHHGQVPEKVRQLELVDRRQMGLLRKLLANLSETHDGSLRLLDNTMILYGSNMGDSNTHDNTNLPILLAGGGLQHGQHLAFRRDDNTPLCNLFLSMLQRMGVQTDAFGSSTGTLSGLETRG
jgi:hypothetical protein